MKGNQNRFKKREREIMADEIRETMKEINKRVKEIELEEKRTGIKSDFVKSQKIIFIYQCQTGTLTRPHGISRRIRCWQ